MGVYKTYDLVITNLTTDESVEIYGSNRGIFGWLRPMKGFGNPDVRTSSYVNSGSDGGYVGDQFYGMRQIPLSVVLNSKSYEEFAEAASLISRVIRIRDDLRVQLFTPTGKVFQVTARLSQPLDPVIGDFPLLADYDIELLASDPIIYDYTDGAALEVTLHRPTLGGLLWGVDGLSWKNDDDVTGAFWEASGGGVIINNSGTTGVWPVVEISGVGTNPSVMNRTTGEVVSLDITTAADDVILIDMYRREVTLNGVSIFNNLVSKQFWQLQAGLNEIVFDSTGEADTATAKVRWNNGYMGVL